MEALLQDVRYAIRSLAKAPGFTVVVMVTLALGIGGNTAVFSVLDTLLLRPLPFADAGRMVVAWDYNTGQGQEYAELSPGRLAALRDRVPSLADVTAFDFAGFTLTGVPDPERLTALTVDHRFFPLLGATPSLGRTVLPEDDRPGAPAVVVLSAGFWHRRFGGDPAVLGRTLLLDGVPATVVGVMPSGFQFVQRVDLWAPLALPDSVWADHRTHWLRMVGKLRPGASLSAARAEVDAVSHTLERELPEANAGWRTSLVPVNEGLFQGPVKPAMLALLGAVGFVLLIACADVANLLLARATTRRREIAIRTALGAGRGRVLRQLLTESLLLALAGGALGLLLATWGLAAIRAALPAVVLDFSPRIAEMWLSGTVLVYTLAVSVVTGVLFGLAPALQAARPDSSGALKESDARGSLGPSRQGLRNTLVAGEIALALVALTGAGLMIRSFVNRAGANPGFRAAPALTVWYRLPEAKYPDRERVAAFTHAALERFARLPGVTAVAVANVLPLSGESVQIPFTIAGRPPAAAGDAPWANVRV
ncbi:MAG: ABC transporter permease, partial [Gemmatimonadales bacterium]